MKSLALEKLQCPGSCFNSRKALVDIVFALSVFPASYFPSVAVDGYSREPAEAVDAEHDSPLEESEWGSLGSNRPLALQLCSTV